MLEDCIGRDHRLMTTNINHGFYLWQRALVAYVLCLVWFYVMKGDTKWSCVLESCLSSSILLTVSTRSSIELLVSKSHKPQFETKLYKSSRQWFLPCCNCWADKEKFGSTNFPLVITTTETPRTLTQQANTTLTYGFSIRSSSIITVWISWFRLHRSFKMCWAL